MGHPAEEERDLVGEAARRALDDANGDVRQAARMLETAARTSPKLKAVLLDPLISEACFDAVRTQLRHSRQRIWMAPNVASGPDASPEALAAQAARVVSLASGSLLMFPLPGGKPLGQASKEEVAAAAGFYGRQATDMRAKARWLEAISKALPEGRRVDEEFDEAALRRLQAGVLGHD